MDFLDKLVISLSGEHIQLLHYLQMLILFIFIPFISIVLGGTTLSLYYRKKGIKEENNTYLKFSKDIIETLTISKWVGLILGIMPVLTSVLLMVQVFHGSKLISVNYLTISFFLIVISLIFIYSYRYSLSINELFNAIKKYKIDDIEVEDSINKFRQNTRNIVSKTGIVGLVILLLSLWFFVAAFVTALEPSQFTDKNFISVILQWHVISKFIFFILIAFAFTGASILFLFFYWEGGKKLISDSYKDFVKDLSIKLTMTASLAVPIFIALNLFALPDNAFSSAVFGFTILGLLLLFLLYHMLYSMMKFSSLKFSGQVFLVMLFVIFSVVVKDQAAIDNATELQSEMLSSQYQAKMQEIMAKTEKPKKISGEQIFQNICSACHAFDHKVVGPPYQQTMPKYEGKIPQLVNFILNPTQNNPGYPPMPNPGLTRPQAEAVAHYIMNTYEQKYKK